MSTKNMPADIRRAMRAFERVHKMLEKKNDVVTPRWPTFTLCTSRPGLLARQGLRFRVKASAA